MPNNLPEIDATKLAEIARTCACFNFRKASRSLTQMFDQILAPSGLRSTQLVILISGQLSGPTSIADMARSLVMDRSTLTRNLRPLMTMGLLQFSPASGGRTKNVELTPAGRAALVQAGPYWEQAQGKIVARFGADVWNRLLADLGAVIEAAQTGAA